MFCCRHFAIEPCQDFHFVLTLTLFSIDTQTLSVTGKCKMQTEQDTETNNPPMNPELLSKSIITILKGICWTEGRGTWDAEGGRLRIRFGPPAGDFFRCMGKDARLIKGLQVIAAVVGRRNGYQATLSLIQNHEGIAGKDEHDFDQNPAFDHAEILRIATGLLASAMGRELRARHVRKNDKLEIKIETDGPEEMQTVAALEEALYAYGFRQGCIIRLSSLNVEKVA